MGIPDKIRIGTRGSLLALVQTDLWIARIRKKYPQITCEKVIIKTEGDKRLELPLAAFGGKGVFVTEFEEAILNGTIDCAVHSAKDMPLELSPELAIVNVLPRGDVRDVLVTRKENPVEKGRQAVIGTGSLRRRVQLAKQYPYARFENLRGNVGTRLEKLRGGNYDGIILAAAGLKRLQLEKEDDLDYTYFDTEQIVPAGGQAIIAVEGKGGADWNFLQDISDERTGMELETERRILKGMQAGCHEAVGVYAKITDVVSQTDYAVPSCLMIRNVSSVRNRRPQIENTMRKETPQIAITVMKEIKGELQTEHVCGPLEDRIALADEMIGKFGGVCE